MGLEEELRKEGTYGWAVTCSNCFKESTVRIPKGEKVREALAKGIVCPNCGVKFIPEE